MLLNSLLIVGELGGWKYTDTEVLYFFESKTREGDVIRLWVRASGRLAERISALLEQPGARVTVRIVGRLCRLPGQRLTGELGIHAEHIEVQPEVTR